MEKHYDKHYFFADKFGGKRWVDAEGKEHEFGYYAGGMWEYEKLLYKLIELLGTPESVLDLGAGCGGWVATLNKNLIEAYGLEFSEYALDNAILGSRKYLVKWNLERVPWHLDLIPPELELGPGSSDFIIKEGNLRIHDWITAIDLFEHLFDDRIDEVIAETKRRAGRWIVAKICTAQLPHEVWAARRGTYEEVLAQAKAEGKEWLVVSGHVNCQWPSYWEKKFVDKDWKLRPDLSERFKRELKLPEDWRTTIILEKLNWFEEEFGKP